jgi:hypothetical protein
VNAGSSDASGGAPLSSSLHNSARKATKPAAKPSPNGPAAGASPEMRDRLVRKATERLSRLLLSTLAATSVTALCVVLVVCLPHRVPAMPALYAIGGCFLVFMDSVQEVGAGLHAPCRTLNNQWMWSLGGSDHTAFLAGKGKGKIWQNVTTHGLTKPPPFGVSGASSDRPPCF